MFKKHSLVSDFKPLLFGFVSRFDIRISDFGFEVGDFDLHKMTERVEELGDKAQDGSNIR